MGESNAIVRRDGQNMIVIRARTVRLDLPNGKSTFREVPLGMSDDDVLHDVASQATLAPPVTSARLEVVESEPSRIHLRAVVTAIEEPAG
jgi:hypothetical protein